MIGRFPPPPDMQRKAALPALGIAAGALVGFAAYSLLKPRLDGHKHPPDDAPGHASRQSRFGDYAVVGRAVTINRPRAELYAFWRDFQNLPRFMENIEKVEPAGPGRWRWIIAAPAWQSVEVETEIVKDVESELIAWRSVEGSQIDTEGRVTFRDTPNGRGTVVEAIVAYKPPAGEVGRVIAKLFGREPEIQGRRELKRFKMLMETGEIATSASHRETEA